MHRILPITAAHWFPGEEVVAMADDVDVLVRLVGIDSTSACRERMGKR
jgi:hypothetical protein